MDRAAAVKPSMQDVAVDIVVPVYNAASDLARCVESVLAHTAPGTWRLILIDDASTEPLLTTLSPAVPPLIAVASECGSMCETASEPSGATVILSLRACALTAFFPAP